MHQQPVADQVLDHPSRSGPTGDVRADAVPPHHESAFGPAARRLEERVETLRAARRKARRDLRVLLRVPPEERQEKLFSARSRYRSRAFAELLVEEARRRVKDDPRQARQLAALVPEVVHWIPGAEGRPWRRALEASGRAHQANALRVAGDLMAADRLFTELRRDLTAAPLEDPRVTGDVASLEASLRIDQRRFPEAAELLDRAIELHRRADARDGLARALIKRAVLARREEQHAVAEEYLRGAAGMLDPGEDAALYVQTVSARALCLCDLDRFDEAEALLDAELRSHQSGGSRWTGLLVLGVRGRIAFGRGDHAGAEEAFTTVHENALELGRDFDATLAALDLAQVYLEQGRLDELEELAAGLALTFRSRGASRETLAALRLFSRAAASRQIDLARLRQVRRALRRASPQHA